MNSSINGMALVVLAGVVGSSTLMPFKYVRVWPWENTWFVYSFFAYLLFPWLTAALTVPSLGSIYHLAGSRTIGLVLLFGIGWGIGVVLYGLALDAVGLSLTSGIIYGCSVAIGSIVPLLAIEPRRILTSYGLEIVLADAVMVLGVIFCARAGGLRDDTSLAQPKSKRNARFARGIILCFVAGLLTPLLNLALTFGGAMIQNALAAGARSFYAADGVWALAVSGGALPSLGLCLIRLHRNRTWKTYIIHGARRNFSLCFLMGAFFIVSTVIYGAAAGLLGRLGPVLGWPVYMSALILGNNFWGWFTGEWTGARRIAVQTMFAGIALQIAAMVMLGGA